MIVSMHTIRRRKINQRHPCLVRDDMPERPVKHLSTRAMHHRGSAIRAAQDPSHSAGVFECPRAQTCITICTTGVAVLVHCRPARCGARAAHVYH